MTRSDKTNGPDRQGIIDTEGEDTLNPYGNALPEGITSRLVREYAVGPYRYTDLAPAIAERDRQKLDAQT